MSSRGRRTETSATSPLAIAPVTLPGGAGVIGMTICPGKKGPSARRDVMWDRDLDSDIAAIREWGATAVVTLMENAELRRLQVADLGARVTSAGLEWLHLPIADTQVPDSGFEAAWEEAGPRLRGVLDSGGRILVHCMGGLGRTGTIAARLLVEAGVAPREAVRLVREARPGAIENTLQEDYVDSLSPPTPHPQTGGPT